VSHTAVNQETAMPRFITEQQLNDGLECFRLTAVGFSGWAPTRHGRICNAIELLTKQHPEMSRGGAYKDLTDALDHYQPLNT